MSSTASTNAPALIGWRLLALFYDLWPAAALWLAVSALFTWLHRNQPLAAFSAAQLALWLACWAVTGLYAVLSWRRGGQTLGMRPWRLRVAAAGGGRAGLRALVLRYVVGTLALLPCGLGFWWAWIDRDRLTWHDRVSGTRMLRDAKAPH